MSIPASFRAFRAGKILRKYPLVGGIDLAGEMVSSSDPASDYLQAGVTGRTVVRIGAD